VKISFGGFPKEVFSRLSRSSVLCVFKGFVFLGIVFFIPMSLFGLFFFFFFFFFRMVGSFRQNSYFE
jgi:predicted membrane protein